jgi:ATP-binding cassette subfamily B protein/subfamily B ATP-binding cassette protein MsbA
MARAESSRRRYRTFVKSYRDRTLEDPADAERKPKASGSPEEKAKAAGKRREYLRDYINWLWPHRFAIAGFFLLALITSRSTAPRACHGSTSPAPSSSPSSSSAT